MIRVLHVNCGERVYKVAFLDEGYPLEYELPDHNVIPNTYYCKDHGVLVKSEVFVE